MTERKASAKAGGFKPDWFPGLRSGTLRKLRAGSGAPGYNPLCPKTHVNTAAVHNSSAVSLFLPPVVVETYVPASSANRKRKAFSNEPKGRKGRPFLLTCAPLAAR